MIKNRKKILELFVMVTIAIKEKIRKRLLMIAGELQKEMGEKINFNDVLDYLTKKFEENRKKPELFKKFCEPPTPKVSFQELYDDLITERMNDEKRYKI